MDFVGDPHINIGSEASQTQVDCVDRDGLTHVQDQTDPTFAIEVTTRVRIGDPRGGPVNVYRKSRALLVLPPALFIRAAVVVVVGQRVIRAHANNRQQRLGGVEELLDKRCCLRGKNRIVDDGSIHHLFCTSPTREQLQTEPTDENDANQCRRTHHNASDPAAGRLGVRPAGRSAGTGRRDERGGRGHRREVVGCSSGGCGET